MAKIQVFSVLGKNGIMFAKFLRKTMTALASGNHDIEFNCFMNSAAAPPDGWTVREYILKQKHTSLNHTTGLNRISEYVAGDYVIASDTDVALVMPNWDEFLINKMENQRWDILGIDHWDHPRGYENFPVVTFFMSKSLSFLKAQTDFRPAYHDYANRHGIGAKEMVIDNQRDAYIFGKEKGQTLLKDSGWQLPLTYKSAGLRGTVFPKAAPYAVRPQVPQAWFFDDTFGICHKGKGSKRRQSKGVKFFEEVKEYLKEKWNVRIT